MRPQLTPACRDLLLQQHYNKMDCPKRRLELQREPYLLLGWWEHHNPVGDTNESVRKLWMDRYRQDVRDLLYEEQQYAQASMGAMMAGHPSRNQ